MRKFLSVLTALVFCAAWPLAIILSSLQFTLLNETFYVDVLRQANTYDRTITILSNNVQSLTNFESFPGGSEFSSSIQQALIQAVTPVWLQAQIETIIQTGLAVVSTPGHTVADITATISLSEPKAALLPVLLSFEAQRPEGLSTPEWLQLFNDRTPNDIPIRYLIAAAVNKESLYENTATMALPGEDFFATENVQIVDKQLATVQNSVQWLKKITYGTAIVSIVMFIALFIFAKGARSKFASLGVTLWIGSIGIALSAAGMYFSRGMLTSFVSSQLPVSSDWLILIKDILDTLIKQYSTYLLWPSLVGLGLGTVFYIISKFIKKPS